MLSKLTLAIAFTCVAFGPVFSARAEPLWRRFVPVRRVEADRNANYTLTQEDGPWLVLACTFSGEGAEEQARELALEFRSRFNLPAYVHNMQFDLSDEDAVGRGVDKHGAPVQMRYRKGNRIREWAVLVGDFPSIDDPKAQQALQTVKTLRPDTLDPQRRGGESSQSYARIRAMQVALVQRLGASKELGPMRTAFMTRNPVLPREYFVPKGVDRVVEKMNRGVEHSLLNNEKKYTIRVATFRGRTAFEGAANAPRGVGSDLGSLHEAARNAHDLTEALRAARWQAWEFHDRNQSYVTIGGYDAPTRRGPDGQPVPIAEVAQIIRTFGAAYDTPEDPLKPARLDQKQAVRAEAERRLQQFNQRFATQHGQITGGLKPKFARVPPDSKNARVIPFDIHPEVIEVPKKSVSAGFAWRR